MDPVPVVDSLVDIYPSEALPAQTQRYRHLVDEFQQLYDRPPAFIARAPGRVNLIGEHIDYCGLPVFPMAIERDCLIAVAPEHPAGTRSTSMAEWAPQIHLANRLRDKFPRSTFQHRSCPSLPSAVRPGGDGPAVVDIDATRHAWDNYFKCGYRGAHELLYRRHSVGLPLPMTPGMLCLVDGDIPTGAGLSSSSAFVSCSVIATLEAQDPTPHVDGKAPGSLAARSVTIPRSVVTDVAIRSERYVGVNSGGMDQTCSIMSLPNAASFIEFFPRLRATPIPFPTVTPAALTFVIANSLVTSDKFVTAPVCYNLRVVETRLGALMLAKYLGIDRRPRILDARPRVHYKLVMDEYFAPLGGTEGGGRGGNEVGANPTTGDDNEKMEDLLKTMSVEADLCTDAWVERLTTMLDRCEQAFAIPADSKGRTNLTREAIAHYLDTNWADLESQTEMDRFPIHADTFQVAERARHVFSEALRVVQFRRICQEHASASALSLSPSSSSLSSTTDGTDLFHQLGDLMNQSQTSCRDDFDCSCPELDALVAVCRAAGAVGSRLTGAGWGGCTVSLVPADRCETFIRQVHREYYQARFPHLRNVDVQSDLIFATLPGRGAVVYRPSAF
ncbi:galactokinase [Tieghemiomyces parasiticus]|uniref:Galactokinase n=1 Tax=Tieghemiomyces parasiticus TaxID=78921 RepID=A0A9W8A9G3_9FUNG|nr:galactokinase [Tieghemiomyces parasiticus]